MVKAAGRTVRLARGAAVAASLAGASLAPGQAAADAVADFYKDKRVRVVIGYTTGGGYDSYARVLARFIGKHIPGQPGVIAQNMPGAGSLLATNWIANAAPRDGTVIGAINRGIPFEPLTGGKGVQFDPLKLGWIGSLGKEVNVTIAWHTSKVKRAEQLFTDGMIVGGTGSGADSAIYPAIMNNLLGAKIKLIAGYPGGNDVNLALERGEIEGRPSPSWSSLRSGRGDWIREGKIVPIWQLSLSKHPDLPNVPLAIDFAKTPEDRQIMEFFFARQEMSRPYVTTPDVAPERLKALRDAFMATTKDPEFIEAAKSQDVELDPISGAEIDELLRRVFATPKHVVDRATQLARSEVPTENAVIKSVKVTAPLLRIEGQGATIVFNDGGAETKAQVSAARTKITIAGQDAKRASLKEAMTCEIDYAGPGGEVRAMSCK
ncbi:MAG: Bug family tripartite tricarboxylate transporter substrate binding protein [Beijerinckiaceae bacterium]